MLSLGERGGAPGRAFAGDRDGASAIEFALILPVMLALWAGMAEVAHMIDNWRKVTQLARTVADLTSQGDPSNNNPMTPATMADILASSTAVLRPFSSANVKIVVTALEVNLTTSPLHPKVCSSVSTSGNIYKRDVGTANDLDIPAEFLQQGQRYIMAEVTATYVPMLGASTLRALVKGINATPTLPASIAWPTRGGIAYNGNPFTEVILPSGAQCP